MFTILATRAHVNVAERMDGGFERIGGNQWTLEVRGNGKDGRMDLGLRGEPFAMSLARVECTIASGLGGLMDDDG